MAFSIMKIVMAGIDRVINLIIDYHTQRTIKDRTESIYKSIIYPIVFEINKKSIGEIMKRIINFLLVITISLLLTGIINGNFSIKDKTVDSSGDIIPVEQDTPNGIYSLLTRSDKWANVTIDSLGFVGYYASIANDTNNRPHISYYDASNRDLKYAYYDGSRWHIEIVDSVGYVGSFNDIVLDSNDHPHISYHSRSNNALKYAYHDGNEWHIETVDWNGGRFSSIALDSQNLPHISYYSDETNNCLKYAWNNSLEWNTTTVDDWGRVGVCSSLIMDLGDRAHISYYDEQQNNLKYARNVSGGWQTFTIDYGGGNHSSIALDPFDRPKISYFSESNNSLNYTYFDYHRWHKETLNFSSGGPGANGRYTSIEVDSNNNTYISYCDDWNQLKYLYYNAPEWIDKIVDTEFCAYTSLTLDSNRIPHIAYGKDDDLQYATIDDESPVLAEDLSGTPTTGELFSFIINASDNVGIGAVNVTYTFDDTNYINKSMNYNESRWGGFQDFWSHNITIPSNSTTIRYWFTLRDQAGNTRGTGHMVKGVVDNDPPQFEEDLSGIPTTGDSFYFAINTSDNIGVNITQVSYTYDIISFQTQTLYDDGTHGDPLADDGIWTSASIDIPPDVTQVNYTYSIWDTAGNVYNTSNITWFQQNISDNDPPQLIEDLTGEIPTTGDIFTVSFNASDNIKIDYTYVIYDFGDDINLSFEMTSSDNGTTWSKSIDIPSDASEMEYWFEINDSSGNGLVTNVTRIDVLDNDDPTASAGVDISINQYDNATFNSINSTDNIGIINYTWIIEYNGTNHTLRGPSATFTFKLPGTYNVTLAVMDEAGNEATDVLTVSVRDIWDYTKPTADAGTNINADQSDNVTLDGSKSNDNVGIGNYTWTFSYNNVNRSLYGRIVIFKFDDPGIYNVTLTVKDAADNIHRDWIIVTVKDTENPKVVGSTKDTEIHAGDKVIFDSSGCTDNVGIVNYTWTFNDDGARILYGATPVYIFTKPGTYTVTLTVSDDAGNNGQAFFSITVNEKLAGTETTDEEGLSTTVIVIIVIVIFLTVLIAIFIFIKKRKAEPTEEHEQTTEPDEDLGEFVEEEKEEQDEEEEETGKDEEEVWDVDDTVGDKEEGEDEEIWGAGKEEDLDESKDSSGLPGRDRSEEDEEEEWLDEDEDEEEPWAEYSPELTPIPSSMEGLIPDYIITNKLGSGGFATVYKANNLKGEPVAIKLPKFMDETIDSSVLNKFKSESDIWKKLKHRNIVKFLKGDIRPVPYMVIEYMEGGNLLNLIKTGQLPVDKVIGLIQEILEGMAYAHRMASVHRDIKPENILFTKDGTPKIADWGIGKFMASESVSKTIGTKGTLIYSAPEQMSQEKYGEVDWSTDVYQLGVVFYEMLTGENPFKADDPIGIMHNIVEKIPVPPSSLRPGIPPEIDAVILRALEKEKAKRFRSADTMLAKLEEGLKDREKNLKHYRSMLNRALKDGMISPEEEEMLEGFRERFGISIEEHKNIWDELDL